ncbi:hypothetical protein H6F39_03010 [Anabaena sp. FACHB-1250]|nr:hypothetical protein [Anabaena sp. FACHB-1250]
MNGNLYHLVARLGENFLLKGDLFDHHQKLKTDVETFHGTSLQEFQSTDID